MAENKVTVIGIAGGTGCGKTTVVKRLVEALPTFVPVRQSSSLPTVI